MWCDWSNSTAESRQARCSSRQLVNSLGTTGYTYAPICELRSNFDGVAGGLEHAFEILLSHEIRPLLGLRGMFGKPAALRLARERNHNGLNKNPGFRKANLTG